MAVTVLLIDRDVEILRVLGAHLESQGLEVARELDPGAALDAADRLAPDVVVLDLALADTGGGLLPRLAGTGAQVIGVVPAGDREAALAGFAAGADRVVERPLEGERLGNEILAAATVSRDRRTAALIAGTPTGLEGFGSQAPMKAVAQQLANIAQSDRTSVLVTGESGVGKGWAARLIHHLGPRTGHAFLEVPTVGREPSALELDLFGGERWSRPGIDRRCRGRIELAGEGSVVIREVGHLPLEFQPLLLRMLEARTFRRVGGDQDITLGARVLATTTRDLGALVEANQMSGDLFYRLSALVLHIPPVRERAEADRRALMSLVHHAISPGLASPPPPISPDALERLVTYAWPGNLREIRQVLERACLMAEGQPAIQVEHLPGELRARPGLGDRRHNSMSLEDVEKRQIESALRYHGGNRTRAAKELRISRATLINKIKRYAITE